MRLPVSAFSALLLFISWQTAPAQAVRKPQLTHENDLDSKTPRWVKMEVPLVVTHDESIGWASADGFWQSIDSSKEKQLAYPIAANITCDRDEKICREVDAYVVQFMLPGGSLQAKSTEYKLSAWTRTSIVADNTDPNPCGQASRLTIDFKSNSVVVTDYPTKVPIPKSCINAGEGADSYSLHGGSWVVMPAPAWNPLSENEK